METNQRIILKLGNWMIRVPPDQAKLAGLYYIWVAMVDDRHLKGAGAVWQNNEISKHWVRQFLNRDGQYSAFLAWTKHPTRVDTIQNEADELQMSILQRQQNLATWDLAWKRVEVRIIAWDNHKWDEV